MKGPDTGLLEAQALTSSTPGATADTLRKVLPHEVVFTGFLFITWVRLVANGAAVTLPAVVFLILIVGGASVIAWAHRHPTPARWRIRLLYYPSIMALAFYYLAPAMALLETPGADVLLNGWDIALLGGNLSAACQSIATPWLTDVMMGAYLFYFIYLVWGIATYCIGDLPRFRLCMVGLFTVHGLGFLGYTIWPAVGPHLHLPFERPLIGTWFTELVTPMVIGGSNGVDVFPSLHLAVSLYLLGFDWLYNRRRFWWVLGPCVALWVSTIYLRYHYFVDLVVGMGLTAVGWVVAAWWSAKRKT